MALQNNSVKRDPLQGYDIKVSVPVSGSETGQLIGAFTSLMFKVVNQTETYLPLNSRIPRMLDGEIIVVWSLEQGLVEADIVTNTFGSDFNTGFAAGRGTLIPRARRFDVNAVLNSPDIGGTAPVSPTDLEFNSGMGETYLNKLDLTLKFCRVDTYSFGVTAGRHVVANAWQGTAQHVVVTNT